VSPQSSPTTTDTERAAIDGVTDRLAQRFVQVHPDAVAATVREVHAEFDGRPIRDYVPLLVEHRARDLLRRMDSASVLVG
jgi:hypothetical protein